MARLQHVWTLARRHGPAALAYLLLTLAYTHPTLRHFTHAVTGAQQGDTLQNYWNVWWVRQAVATGQHPFHSDFIHYPFGLGLYFHTYNFLNGLLSLPVQLCCGTASAYNTMNMLAFVLAGLGIYALVLALLPSEPATPRRMIAFVAGLVYAFSPYMALHLTISQPFMLALHWLPFYLLCLLCGLRTSWRWLPLAALLLLLIALTDWHYTIYALLSTALVGLFEIGRRRSWSALRAISGRLALVGGLFLLGIAPVLLPMVQELGQGHTVARDLRHSIYHSTDLLAFFIPSIYHPLWGDWAHEIFSSRLVETFITGGVASLGYVPLVLAGCALLFARRHSALFGLLFVVFFLLALGPYLRVNGYRSDESAMPIPLPYLLFRELPFMDIHRIPSRFVSVVMLALAVLTGLGLYGLWRRFRLARLAAWRQYGLLGVAAVLILFEFWPRPFVLTPVGPEQVSPFFRQVAADPESYAILEIPELDYMSMFYQTHHGKPIFGGNISRPRGHPWRWARLMHPVIEVEPTWQDVGINDTPAATRAALRCQGVRYVVVYKQEVGEATRRRIRQVEQRLFAGQAPVYEDAELRAYDLRQENVSPPYWTPAPNEWYDLDIVTSAEIPSRWVQGDRGALLIYPCGQQQALLRLHMFGYNQPRTIEIRLNDAPVGEFTLASGWIHEIALALPLHSGENRVEFRSREPPAAPDAANAPDDTRLLSFNISQVSVSGYE